MVWKKILIMKAQERCRVPCERPFERFKRCVRRAGSSMQVHQYMHTLYVTVTQTHQFIISITRMCYKLRSHQQNCFAGTLISDDSKPTPALLAEPLFFPVTLEVKDISVFELASVHTFTRNKVVFQISCGGKNSSVTEPQLMEKNNEVINPYNAKKL